MRVVFVLVAASLSNAFANTGTSAVTTAAVTSTATTAAVTSTATTAAVTTTTTTATTTADAITTPPTTSDGQTSIPTTTEWDGSTIDDAVITTPTTIDQAAVIAGLSYDANHPSINQAAVIAGLSFDVNQHWMIYAGSLVFLMQAGFSLLEAGSVSAKSATNILYKNCLDACIGAFAFFACGYAFAYGDPNLDDSLPHVSHPKNQTANYFIGTSNFFLTAEDGQGYRNFFFQWAFAATAATIVSGAVAERIKIQAYFIYSVVITAIIYPVVVHWVWSSDGFMCNWHADVEDKPFIMDSMNLIDFAGSGVVHLTGGICALVGAIFTGPRIGRFQDNNWCGCFTPSTEDKVVGHTAHNRMFASLGVLILWFGWYGFNAGSTLDIADYGSNAGRITVTTTLSAASCAVTVMIIQLIVLTPRCKRFDVMAPLNGILSGLVSITAGCNVVTPEGSIGIGMIGGVVYSLSSFTLRRLRIDDPLDAFSVHGACGIWGVVAVGFFGTPEYICAGLSSDCTTILGQLAMQIVGVLLIILWTGATSIFLFGMLRLSNMLRVNEKSEIRGLDFAHHLGYTGILRYPQELEHTTGKLHTEASPTPDYKSSSPTPETKHETNHETKHDKV